MSFIIPRTQMGQQQCTILGVTFFSLCSALGGEITYLFQFRRDFFPNSSDGRNYSNEPACRLICIIISVYNDLPFVRVQIEYRQPQLTTLSKSVSPTRRPPAKK